MRLELVSSNSTLLMDGLTDAQSGHNILVGNQSQRNTVLISQTAFEKCSSCRSQKKLGTQKWGPIKQFMESSVVPYISFTEPLTKIWVSHLPCSNHIWLSQMCSLQLWSKWTRGCQHKNIHLGGREGAFFTRKKIGGIKIKSFKNIKYFAFLLFILRMNTLLSSHEGFKIN